MPKNTRKNEKRERKADKTEKTQRNSAVESELFGDPLIFIKKAAKQLNIRLRYNYIPFDKNFVPGGAFYLQARLNTFNVSNRTDASMELSIQFPGDVIPEPVGLYTDYFLEWLDKKETSWHRNAIAFNGGMEEMGLLSKFSNIRIHYRESPAFEGSASCPYLNLKIGQPEWFKFVLTDINFHNEGYAELINPSAVQEFREKFQDVENFHNVGHFHDLEHLLQANAPNLAHVLPLANFIKSLQANALNPAHVLTNLRIAQDYRPWLHRMLELLEGYEPSEWHNPKEYPSASHIVQCSKTNDIANEVALAEFALQKLFSGSELDSMQQMLKKARIKSGKFASIPRLNLGPTIIQDNSHEDNWHGDINYESIAQGSVYLIEALKNAGMRKSDAENRITAALTHYIFQQTDAQVNMQTMQRITAGLQQYCIAAQAAKKR